MCVFFALNTHFRPIFRPKIIQNRSKSLVFLFKNAPKSLFFFQISPNSLIFPPFPSVFAHFSSKITQKNQKNHQIPSFTAEKSIPTTSENPFESSKDARPTAHPRSNARDSGGF
jgi:hypothetical protein